MVPVRLNDALVTVEFFGRMKPIVSVPEASKSMVICTAVSLNLKENS